MEARASAKFLRGSPQKARLVIDMIRGKNVNQALAIQRYSNKRAALCIEKCVKSAIANANATGGDHAGNGSYLVEDRPRCSPFQPPRSR